MNENVVHNQTTPNGPVKTALLGKSNALVVMAGNSNSGASPLPQEIGDGKSDLNTGDYYDWGENNDWPYIIRRKLEKSTSAYPLIFKAVSLIYGDGIQYYKEVKDGNKLDKSFESIPEIDDFFRENRINRFMLEQLMDYKFYGNAWSEFILAKKLEKITEIHHKEAEFCRIKRKESKDIAPTAIGYSGLWLDLGSEAPKPIGLLNPRERNKEAIQKKFKATHKFAYHTFFPSPGRAIYAMPSHGGLYRKDGWLDYANSVPEIMNAINQNQISIKYHIKIPYEYWTAMYKDWDAMTQKKREEAIDKKLKEMDEWLSGGKNAGKAFVSHFAVDPVSRKPIAGWEIIAVDDKVKKGEYIPSVQEADAQIARAIGLDSSLSFLQSQGNSMGAGSGSDKRIGFQNTVALTKAEQEVLFEPLYLIRDFNGWDKDIKFSFKHQTPTTLDVNPTGNNTQM